MNKVKDFLSQYGNLASEYVYRNEIGKIIYRGNKPNYTFDEMSVFDGGIKKVLSSSIKEEVGEITLEIWLTDQSIIQCSSCGHKDNESNFYNSAVHSNFKICPICGVVRYVCDNNRGYRKGE